MARLVNPSPPLPYAGSSISVSELARFDADLVRMLTFYLRDLAERANASVPLDGSEVMTGPLDLGGFDINNVGNITSAGDITSERLRLTATDDVSLSSTLHGFQIGPTSGQNLAVDGNEIMSRNNGAVAGLFLNFDGGGVSVGGALNLTGTSGGQIVFPATQNPSVDVHTLDDYEEGSWTPGLTINGSTTGITFGARIGAYVKIGRLVFASFDMTLTNKGASAGVVVVTGLPFTIATVTAGFIMQYSTAMAGLTGTPGGFGSGTIINLADYAAAGATQLFDTNLTNTSRIIMSGVYLA